MGKYIVIIIGLLIIASLCVGCSSENIRGETTDGKVSFIVGDAFTTNLTYCGYLPNENVIVFGRSNSQYHSFNIFVPLNNNTAKFLLYEKSFSLSNIVINEVDHSLSCSVYIK